MMVFLSKDNIRMSDKKTLREKVGKSFLRQKERSKTISVSYFTNGDDRANNEGPPNDKSSDDINDIHSDDKPPSPVSQPTLSYQALKYAVSSLARIDDFILEELGGGFFANVYKATHRVTGEEMVMKINKDYANRSGALREVQLMNRMSHPNILRFLGVCVHEGQLHALTEYISGGTLEALLANKKEELPWMLRIRLALDIAQGMHYLHSEGVFHRDLTSRNILIKKGENRNYQAVIADFGLAIKIPDPKSTEPLPPVGCPWWMAPEVIHGKFYDERADLFSYGIILLEITARIEADPETMPRTKNFGVDYVKVCEMVEYCPLDFLQLAFKCCQILPDRRPSSGVIKITLERIYKNLHNDTVTGSGRLRKRSKSEDNIIQSSDSFTENQEEDIFMTLQNVAQAMTKDDPHYSPTNANPFADISKFKDGRKLRDFPRQRKCSGNSTGLGFTGKYGDMAMSSHLSENLAEKQKSQSLPSSPIMLRKAAEKMHLASLLGSDAVQLDSQHDLRSSLSIDNQKESEAVVVVDRRAQFSNSRTKSLGSLDFWNPRHGPGALIRGKGGKSQFFPHHSQRRSHDNQSKNIEGKVISGNSSYTDEIDTEIFHSEHNSNVNCSIANSTYHMISSEDSEMNHPVPHESCKKNSLSISSRSSSVSCEDIVEEEEETREVTAESPVPYQDETQSKESINERNCLNCHVLSKPQVTVESGSCNL